MNNTPGNGVIEVALFGGMFDPVHLGHLLIASAAAEEYGLDTVFFLPGKSPPHKAFMEEVSDALRLRMLEAAIKDNPCFELLEMELKREGTTYTVDTVAALREQGVAGRIAFIIGEDHLPLLHTWKAIDRLKNELLFLVAPRGTDTLDMDRYDLPRGLMISSIRSVPFAVSSSEIRERLKQNRSIRYLVPEPVRNIIEKEGLYQ